MKLVIIIVVLFLGYKLLPVIFRESGRAAGYSGDFEKALKRLNLAVKLSGNVKNKNLYGYMLMQNGRFRDAVTVFNEIILDRAILPANKITSKVYRAMAKCKLGNVQEALEDSEEIFENVKNTLTYSLLGYMRQANGDAALDLCLEAYDYNDDDRDICDNLAVAYYMTGDYDSAMEMADEVREKFPSFVEGYYHSAQIAAKKGDKKAALEFLEKTEDCNRTVMTTVTVEDIEALKEELKNA
ncbi:MAG: tetratricopeptide repeat protein [Ruminococcaceae bacterium]|nr:tetratricopeptide repeat protein [Oscillospiraceae bacterium]